MKIAWLRCSRDYAGRGVQLIAINSNDDVAYPEDSLPNMKARAQAKGFNFPYLRDASQLRDETPAVATTHAIGCTIKWMH